MVLLLAALLAIYSHFNTIFDSKTALSRDLAQDHLMGMALNRGENPYQNITTLADRFYPGHQTCIFLNLSPHPPTLVLLFSLLSGVSFLALSLFWYAGSVLAVMASLAISFKLFGLSEYKKSLAVVLSLLFLSLPLGFDLQSGQLNTFILLIACLHAWLYQAGKRFTAGAILGLGFAIKLFGSLFVLYYLYKREYKLLSGMLTSILLAVLLSFSFYSSQTLSDYVFTVLPSSSAFWSGALGNISLSSVPVKILMPVYYLLPENACFVERIISDIPPHISLAGLLLTICVLCLGFYRLQGENFLHAFSLLLALSSLVNPISWSHYAIWCLPLLLLKLQSGIRTNKFTAKQVTLIILAFALFFIDYAAMPAIPEHADLTTAFETPWSYNLLSLIPTLLILLLIFL